MLYTKNYQIIEASAMNGFYWDALETRDYVDFVQNSISLRHWKHLFHTCDFEIVNLKFWSA